MKFRHPDGADAPDQISLGPVRDSVATDADGVFEVDEDREDYEDVVERLQEAGHTSVEQEAEDDEPEATAEDAVDVEAFVDRTPMSEVVEDIESGTVDDVLDAVEAAEQDTRDRKGVLEAIEDRREALDDA